MSSRKQPAANPANAQNPSSPTTQGQPATRYDAAKHGIFAHTQIMFDESAEDLAALAAEYHEQYNPADSTKRFLVDTLIYNEWRLRRMRRVEADLWQHASDSFLGQNMELTECTSGDCFATAAAAFERLQRIVNSCERSYHRALKELAARAHGRQTPQPEESKTTSEPSGSFRNYPNPPACEAPNPPQAAPNPVPGAEPLQPVPPPPPNFAAAALAS